MVHQCASICLALYSVLVYTYVRTIHHYCLLTGWGGGGGNNKHCTHDNHGLYQQCTQLTYIQVFILDGANVLYIHINSHHYCVHSEKNPNPQYKG